VHDRIELNPKLSSTPISGGVLHEVCSHALAVAPEECCGLIASSAEERFGSVYRISNVMTKKHLSDEAAFPRDARHAYYMSEVEYFAAQKEVEARGERITAVYHSHIGADAYLSSEDRMYAEHPLFPFPDAAQIVLSVMGKRIGGSVIFEVDRENGGFEAEGGRRLEVLEAAVDGVVEA